MDLFQPRLIDVGVDLGRCNARVSEHFLNLPKIGATRQKMSGKTVSQ